jgi:hypothetical protein
MKLRTSLFPPFILFLLALGGIVFFRSLPKQELQVFPATVNRDCAPWDGAAFTVAIQYDASTEIYISIWKSPDIKFPSTFVLPDGEGQVGSAYILSELGPLVELSGETSFQRVDVGMPLEGRFSFTSERGGQFEGQFIAEWGEQVVMCG